MEKEEIEEPGKGFQHLRHLRCGEERRDAPGSQERKDAQRGRMHRLVQP